MKNINFFMDHITYSLLCVPPAMCAIWSSKSLLLSILQIVELCTVMTTLQHKVYNLTLNFFKYVLSPCVVLSFSVNMCVCMRVCEYACHYVYRFLFKENDLQKYNNCIELCR